MKKLYTLALAAAVALSASADRQTATNTVNIHSAQAVNVEATLPTTGKALKAPSKVTAEDFAGEYTWTYSGLLVGQTTGMTGAAEIAVSANGATVTLDGFTMKATIDAAAGTISIPNKQYIGKDADGDIYFYLKNVDGEGNLLDGANSAAASVGTLGADGTITFPAVDIWALGDFNNEAIGWYFLTYQNSLVTPEEPEPENWVSLGNGSFIENILYPNFNQKAENKQAAEVEVLTDELHPGRYKVLNPLKTLYTALNFSGTSPEMVFDATDPANVVIEMTSTGISSGDLGLVVYLSQSKYYQLTDGIEATPAANRVTLTRENGTSTLTIPYRGTFYMGMSDASNSLYYGSLFVSTLTFKEEDSNAGVGNITVSEGEGAVEYYNLQGVRLSEPTTGVVIRVQGGKASKVLVK